MMRLLKLPLRPTCPYCNIKTRVGKHGKARSGLARYRCLDCGCTFQSKYIYAAYQA
ncbi:IS1 family transposase [Budvicia aquatica]|uniref:IS1 family transposase n=1 Tax=Budvicia aquatica TaxID=82979 RepID=UPI000FDB295C|nr:IS1 family transposase [Budvicia aquatica]